MITHLSDLPVCLVPTNSCILLLKWVCMTFHYCAEWKIHQQSKLIECNNGQARKHKEQARMSHHVNVPRRRCQVSHDVHRLCCGAYQPILSLRFIWWIINDDVRLGDTLQWFWLTANQITTTTLSVYSHSHVIQHENLVVDGRPVTSGTAQRGLAWHPPMQTPLYCTKCNRHPSIATVGLPNIILDYNAPCCGHLAAQKGLILLCFNSQLTTTTKYPTMLNHKQQQQQ